MWGQACHDNSVLRATADPRDHHGMQMEYSKIPSTFPDDAVERSKLGKLNYRSIPGLTWFTRLFLLVFFLQLSIGMAALINKLFGCRHRHNKLFSTFGFVWNVELPSCKSVMLKVKPVYVFRDFMSTITSSISLYVGLTK